MSVRKNSTLEITIDKVCQLAGASVDPEDMKIVEKSSKIVMKRDKSYKDDSDYVRDSTETNSSGGSSSTSVYAAGKVRRILRAVRNKPRESGERRRNPKRVSKKNADADFPILRQRLLTVKRKQSSMSVVPSKRPKLNTATYMNTRSVTRKLYNVGATYHAPTIRDETEWKEWPVHGMHERPIFLPQVGLAVEFFGRYFRSADGHSYSEIFRSSDVEVVSVDPRSDVILLSENKRKRVTPTIKGSPSRMNAAVSSEKKENFDTCMHSSLHSVFAYGSQTLSPSYKNNIQCKIIKLPKGESLIKPDQAEGIKIDVQKQGSAVFMDSTKKDNQLIAANEQPQEYKPTNSTTTMNSQIKNKAGTKILTPRLFPMYIANPRKPIALANLKNLRGAPLKVQKVIRTSKHPLVLVTTERKNPGNSTKSDLNIRKIEEVPITSDNLLNMTSIYNADVVQAVNLNANENTKENVSADLDSRKADPCKSNSSIQNKTLASPNTMEIARILAEYNKQIKTPLPKNFKIQLNSSTCCNVKNNVKQSTQNMSTSKNMCLKVPQAKWRKFNVTVEKSKNPNGNSPKKVFATTKQLVRNGQVIGRPAAGPIEATPPFPEMAQAKLVVNHSQFVQELLENTAVLYCASSGIHQDDLANYVNTLDGNQSVHWLNNACD